MTAFMCFTLAGCSTPWGKDQADINLPPVPPTQGSFKVGNPYIVGGKRYRPTETYRHTETGIASWYGPQFHGKKTANGETFDMNELTAAHRTLQMPSLVRVTNLENGRSLVVRINDRGPFSRGRVIDVSRRAAELLGFKNQGTARVRLDLLEKESKAIAQAAKRGESTRGVEVAMNQSRTGAILRPATPTPVPEAQPVSGLRPVSVASVESESLSPSDLAIPGHIKDGAFIPDPVVRTVPVQPSNLYVQAGAFAQQGNAYSFAQGLKAYGNAQVYPAVVNGKQFFRVRLGPIETVKQADALLARLASGGINQAITVVD